MTSRERVFATLKHQQADRVPLAEMWIDPKIVRTIAPGAKDANDLVAHLDLDMVTVPTMIYGPDEVEWVDREKGIFRDKWGGLQHLTQEAIPVPTTPARIESEEDLAAYTPPDPAKSPVIEKVRRLRARFPDKAVAVVGESGWAPAAFLRGGIENLFLDLALRPEFAGELMGIGAAYYAKLFPLAVAAGADVIFLGDDYSDKNGPRRSSSRTTPRWSPRSRRPGPSASSTPTGTSARSWTGWWVRGSTASARWRTSPAWNSTRSWGGIPARSR